jgi:succinate-semialdehyde dehydrogenase
MNHTYFISWQVFNPATGEVIVDVACMGRKETNDAISSAYDAYSCMEL